MKIEKGQKYLCVKEQTVSGHISCFIGKIYEAIDENWIESDTGKYFIEGSEDTFHPIEQAKWAIKRTPENSDEVNRWANESFEHDSQEYYCSKYDYIHSNGILQGRILDDYTEIDLTTFREITGSGEEKPKQTSGEKEVVHCPTLELAEKVIEILKDRGKNPSFDASVYFNEKGTELCFRVFGHFGYQYIEWYKKEGYTIIPAEQFIRDNQPKIYTIEDVRNGKCAIKNDGTREELFSVLKYAFPEDTTFKAFPEVELDKPYYEKWTNGSWGYQIVTDLPTQSVKLFLKQIEGEKEQSERFTGEWEKDNLWKTETAEWQPKWGEEVEVSLDGLDWEAKIFVGINPFGENCRKYVVVSKNKGHATSYTYCRKTLETKTFTIDQAKQDLAKLYNINFNQVEII